MSRESYLLRLPVDQRGRVKIVAFLGQAKKRHGERDGLEGASGLSGGLACS
jgi:hypothetical protein